MRDLLASDVAKAVYDVMTANNVAEDDMLTVLGNVVSDFNRVLRVDVEVNEKTLNMLRDTVWYNNERVGGDDTLGRWGKVFPHFMGFGDLVPVHALADLQAEVQELMTKVELMELTELTAETNDAFAVGAPVWIHGKGSKKPDVASEKIVHCRLHGQFSANQQTLIVANGLLQRLNDACADAKTKHVPLHVQFV